MEPDLGASGTDWSEQTSPFLGMGAGVEHSLSRSVGLGLVLGNQYALMDGLDGVKEGSGMDSVRNLTFSLSLYPSAGR